MDVASNAAIEPHVINVPLDQIHDDGDDMRRTKISARSDAAMTSSIKRRGVLQAIGVRPNGNGYRIVFGRGRLRCARAAGLTEIPADVRDWQDAEIRAVQGAENMQRRPPHPVDVWLTVRDLVDEGYTIAEAAAELGLDDRQALQMERLGRLDDKLLKLCEIEMPDDRYLRVIANAPAKLQHQVAGGSRNRLVIPGAGERELVQWNLIAEACRVQRISRQLAIFDAAAHPKLWEEDLFVPSDFPDAITTRDVAGFMKLQKAALETRVETDRKAKKRVQLAEYDGSKYPAVALPKGWKLQGSHAPQNGWRPKKTESVFVALAPDGRIIEVLGVDVAAQKAADKVKADRQKTGDDPAHSQTREDGEPDADDPTTKGAEREEPDQAEVEAITKAGLDLVAKAKTEALHKALTSASTASKTVAPSILLRLVLMAFAASNVTLRPHDIDYEDVLAHLVNPDGQPIDLNPVELAKLARDALTRILRIGGPGTYGMNASGDAAEWIGATIDAGAQLPRFDTEEFLKQVRGSVLVDLADQAGIKSSGTVTALRARLVGQLPNWRPHAAQFGAPGPVCE